jgi:hypothetical protein
MKLPTIQPQTITNPIMIFIASPNLIVIFNRRDRRAGLREADPRLDD